MSNLKPAAFSLIELLITLLLMASLTLLTLPRLTAWLAGQKTRAIKLTLLQNLSFASQEALVRHLPIIFCGSTDAMSCDANWSQGQLLFIDSEYDGKLHTLKQRLATLPALEKEQHLFYRGYPRYHHALYFYPQGKVRNDNGSFWFCQQQQLQWAVRVNQMGQWQVLAPDSDGNIFDAEGEQLAC